MKNRGTRLCRSRDSTPAERRRTWRGADRARLCGAREVAHSERKKNCDQRGRIKKKRRATASLGEESRSARRELIRFFDDRTCVRRPTCA
ncbi:MAG: hypothetical protein CTY30_11630 [Methylocystis sp.]|nr:MAG: hypothetical protein CTY30_11630 [Methylocystis sp.]